MEINIQEKNIAERVPDNALLADIPVIEEGGILVLTRENISSLVEAPLLEACEKLYDMNIQTIMSSANKSDIEFGGNAYIDINFDSLSDQNKDVALQLGELFEMHGFKPTKCIKLRFPVNKNTTVGEIRKMAHEVVLKFKKQEMTWAKRNTIDDLASMYGIPKEDLTPESFPELYYDDATGFFYSSKEHFEKVNSFI